MVTTREPGPGHQKLMADLHGVLGRAQLDGIATLEQVVILAQLIGQKISDLPKGEYEVAEVMRAVSLNMLAGNRQAGGGALADPVGHG